jgi:CxxC motif-containing protein
MTELICIICPQGCHLTVDEANDHAVTGEGCKRGIAYGKAELQNPTRTLTSTIPISGAMYRRCPVKTSAPIPKALIFDVMKEIGKITLSSPVSRGQLIRKSICGTGVDLITTRAL